MPLRTFIALKFSREIEEYLEECVARLKKRGVDASFTKPGNHHLTLKFLGVTKEEIVPQISKALEGIDVDFPIGFAVTQLDGFPNLKNPRVVFLGLDCPAVKELAEMVDGTCFKLGFSKEQKLFVPHLTLCRLKEKADLSAIDEALPKPPKCGSFIDIILFKSDLSPQGSTYTALWQKGKND